MTERRFQQTVSKEQETIYFTGDIASLFQPLSQLKPNDERFVSYFVMKI
jgi:hypothetical protein